MSDLAHGDEQESSTPFSRRVLGEAFFSHPSVKKILGLSPGLQVAIWTGFCCALLFLPYLGAVGLWDPWETHYGEVAREMIQRSDYVYPYWESAWFFSKPPLTMWMQALGMQMVGTNRDQRRRWGSTPSGACGCPSRSWHPRGVAAVAWRVARVGEPARRAWPPAFVLGTMPLYFLLTRQAVTDTPFVATLSAPWRARSSASSTTRTKHRAAWWYGFYVFCGCPAGQGPARHWHPGGGPDALRRASA